ncbi:SSURE domain-containing protein [Streptococcus halotolerans]|uniref:SSURE domain-containing protein n=1 Tax=Streptococcus halotolerans TaxID=1814128 RepID=UPI00078995B7|nr:fibronectin-binding SSURE repeat-containing protein [Streptococcus halotolerans]
MLNFSTKGPKESFTKGSLHYGKVSLASIIIASGSIVALAQGNQVRADDMTNQPVSSVTTSPSTDATPKMSPEMSNTEASQPAKMTDMSNTSETSSTTDTSKMMEMMDSQTEASSDAPSTAEMPQATVTSPETVTTAVEQVIHEDISVPESYVKKANFPGPFTAGVNQVIPFEAFGGDGMLTRLLLKSSDGAAWSDNGKDMNPALLPLENLSKGHYFYNLELEGALQGKMDDDLLKTLKAMSGKTITGKVLVYAAKGDMPDLSKILASKMVTLHLNKEQMMEDKHSDKGMTGMMDKPSMDKMNMPEKNNMPTTQSKADMSAKMMTANQKSDMMDPSQKEMAKDHLPMTGETNHQVLTGVGLVTLLVAFGMSLKTFLSKKKAS